MSRAHPVPSPADPVLGELLRRCSFDLGDPAGPTELDVAVSGGPDSTALLALALATGAGVTAHHVDHGLRAASGAEAGFVQRLCRHWGAGFTGHRVVVHDGPDLERRCREARLGVLPSGCLKGHTADDQAETVLMRLMRGTGPAGLAAMDPATHPILRLRRSETVSVCEHLGVRPVSDPMNESGRFTRNQVRSELLPLMSEVAGRDVVPLLARTAELAAENTRALAWLVEAVDPTDARAVAAVPTPLAAEAMRLFWSRETGGLLPPDRQAVERMLAVARGESRSTQVGAGWTLRRRAGSMWLEGPVPPCEPER
jgi:tRNA(Ile)-lysidine synthase